MAWTLWGLAVQTFAGFFGAVCTENLDSEVLVMKSTKDRV
jgi:hypothetical protein